MSLTQRWLRIVLLCFLLPLVACADEEAADVPGAVTVVGEDGPAAGAEAPAVLNVTSAAFAQGEAIPARHTCDGEDVSLPLAWGEPPAGTRAFVLIMDDPDAPNGTWDHWLLFNIPAASRALPAGVPAVPVLADGSRHGANSWDRLDYGGPCPPSGQHRYFFRLYALAEAIEVAAGADKTDLLAAMDGHVLAQGELMGVYARP